MLPRVVIEEDAEPVIYSPSHVTTPTLVNEESHQDESSNQPIDPIVLPKHVSKKTSRFIEELGGRIVRGNNCYVEEMVGYALQIADEIESEEPSSYKEAIVSSESVQWLAAMSEEMESLHKNNTWELVPPQERRKLIGCKWVFRKKEGTSEAETVRYKARLVLRGLVR
ncbi:uncharacterized protein LOC141607153 [Silene latifolia]|uniref:uncharacterized protein LOC141607153 n=1 Tax=Silene latifolia TaxID=37657 RepID=UPI003D77E945